MEKLGIFQFLCIHLQVGPNSMQVQGWWVYISSYPDLDGFIYLKEASLMQVGMILILRFNQVGSVVVTYFSLTSPFPSFFAFRNQIYVSMSSHPDFRNIYIISCFIISSTFFKEHYFSQLKQVIYLVLHTFSKFNLQLLSG